MKKLIQVVCAFAAAALLAGCSGKSEDQIPGPVAFDKHDRCHICGMVILNYPGAKAQVFVKGEKEPLKFCSVKDGFVYVLQPENAKRTVAFWVSDFGNKKDIPLHEKMLTAEKAFFNAGSDVRGAMGKSILPFATKGEVEAFTKEHGGKIVNYSEVNLELLKSLKDH